MIAFLNFLYRHLIFRDHKRNYLIKKMIRLITPKRPYAATVATIQARLKNAPYQPGQFFIHKHTPYRGVIINNCQNLSEKSAINGDFNAFEEMSAVAKMTENNSRNFYHVLIDRRDWDKVNELPTDIRVPRNIGLSSDSHFFTSNPLPGQGVGSPDIVNQPNYQKNPGNPFQEPAQQQNNNKNNDDSTRINQTQNSKFSLKKFNTHDPFDEDPNDNDIYKEGHDIVNHNDILPIDPEFMHLYDRPERSSAFGMGQGAKDGRVNISEIFHHRDLGVYFKSQAYLPAQAWQSLKITPRIELTDRKIKVIDINHETGIKIQMIISYIGNRHFSYIPAMHWWQVRYKVTNTSAQSVRFICNQWVHHRYNSTVGYETPHVEEDKSISSKKPLIEPYINAVYTQTVPHCVDDQEYIGKMKGDHRANRGTRGNSSNGGYKKGKKYKSSKRAAKNSKKADNNIEKVDYSDENFPNQIKDEKTLRLEAQAEELISESSDFIEKNSEVFQLLQDELENDKKRKSNDAKNKETVENIEGQILEPGEKLDRVMEDQLLMKRMDSMRISSPEVYGLFMFRMVGHTSAISIKTPVIKLDHRKFHYGQQRD